MSDQEEQARKLDQFHDKHNPVQSPDWLKAEYSDQERPSEGEILADQDFASMMAALRLLVDRLDTLRSIGSHNILIPGGPQERYHELMEEAYAALGKVETVIDELSHELEYQHKRLDEARDAALAEATPPEQKQQSGQPFGMDAVDTAERAHEDWANEE
jgi:hypothetical protein